MPAHSFSRLLALYPALGGVDVATRDAVLTTQAATARPGQASEACDMVLLSPEGFARWAAFDPFRQFAFGVLPDRLADLMALTEAGSSRGCSSASNKPAG
jgi:CRP/FNR family transcriptional regulator, anaerobic regulatory protein